MRRQHLTSDDQGSSRGPSPSLIQHWFTTGGIGTFHTSCYHRRMKRLGGMQTNIVVRKVEDDGYLVAMAAGDESIAVRVTVSHRGDDAQYHLDARRRAREIAVDLAAELTDDPD